MFTILIKILTAHTPVWAYSFSTWLILLMPLPVMPVSFPSPAHCLIFHPLITVLSFIHQLKCHSYLNHCHTWYYHIKPLNKWISSYQRRLNNYVHAWPLLCCMQTSCSALLSFVSCLFIWCLKWCIISLHNLMITRTFIFVFVRYSSHNTLTPSHLFYQNQWQIRREKGWHLSATTKTVCSTSSKSILKYILHSLRGYYMKAVHNGKPKILCQTQHCTHQRSNPNFNYSFAFHSISHSHHKACCTIRSSTHSNELYSIKMLSQEEVY